MKFPRNAKIIRSHFDVAPFAAVFFLLLIFLMIQGLIPTKGIPMQSLHPPVAADLPGVDTPSVAMAVDAQERLYFENKQVDESVLKTGLMAATSRFHGPLTLVIHADKAASWDRLAQLSLLARDCGITNAVLATLPPRPAIKP